MGWATRGGCGTSISSAGGGSISNTTTMFGSADGGPFG